MSGTRLTDAEAARATVSFVRLATDGDSAQAITVLIEALLTVTRLATMSPAGVVAVLDALIGPLQQGREMAASRLEQPAVAP